MSLPWCPRRAGLAALVVAAVASAAEPPRDARRVLRGLVSWLIGNPADVTKSTRPALVLAGGGSDVNAAMTYFGEQAGGGDLVVLRASGGAGYNQYLFSLTGADSVETLLLPSRQRAEDPYALARLAQAEGVFLAGGNQADYVTLWGGTALASAIDAVAARGAPVGGASAGLAILGEWVFAALAGTVTSAQALADPYHERVTIVRHLLRLPALAGVITDSHFAARDRMGRLVAFLGRIATDWAVDDVRGIGVDEATALLIEENGRAVVVGQGAVYFLRAPGQPERCVPGEPLTFHRVSVQRATAGQSFHLLNWLGHGLTSYTVSAEAGILTSSQVGGRLY